MFENKIIKGVHASRFIMSWIRQGGNITWIEGINDFKEWLKSLGLSKEEVNDICEMATNGKLELEISAKNFIENISH